MTKHNLVEKLVGRNCKREATEGGRGAETTDAMGTSVHCSLLEEVFSTSTIFKGISEIAVEKGMLTQDQLK